MSLLSKLPLNIELMKEPVNWAILFLMIAIAGFAISVIFPQSASADNT